MQRAMQGLHAQSCSTFLQACRLAEIFILGGRACAPFLADPSPRRTHTRLCHKASACRIHSK